MPRLRSILSIFLVLVTTFLVSCSSPDAVKIPTTYSPEKIAQLQIYVAPIEAARENMKTLEGFIAKKNWVDTRTYIHGPLGQLRQDMLNLSRDLLPKDQKKAESLAKELFKDFENIDTTAKERNSYQAELLYQAALKDFDAFLDLIPSAS